jgi:Holliday junction resolvase-like predicted endonuclease
MQQTYRFQSAASEQGRSFHSDCLNALKYAGFDIVHPHGLVINEVGIEIDIVAQNRHDITMFFECKGSLRKSKKDRPGLERTDTLKKAIANAYLFSLTDEYQCCSPLIVFASHAPTGGAGLAMLTAMSRNLLLDVINPREHGERLLWLSNACQEEIEQDMEKYPIIELLRRRWLNCK